MAISIDTIRVGKKYYLVNHGERYEFFVVEKIKSNDYQLKDIITLELYTLQSLIQFGKGNDYDLRELD